jgi:hypothetical protein
MLGSALRFDNQEPGRSLLSMPESVIYEWKFAYPIGGKFKHHAASGRHTEGLYPVHRAFRRRSQTNARGV